MVAGGGGGGGGEGNGDYKLVGEKGGAGRCISILL